MLHSGLNIRFRSSQVSLDVSSFVTSSKSPFLFLTDGPEKKLVLHRQLFGKERGQTNKAKFVDNAEFRTYFDCFHYR